MALVIQHNGGARIKILCLDTWRMRFPYLNLTLSSFTQFAELQ